MKGLLIVATLMLLAVVSLCQIPVTEQGVFTIETPFAPASFSIENGTLVITCSGGCTNGNNNSTLTLTAAEDTVELTFLASGSDSCGTPPFVINMMNVTGNLTRAVGNTSITVDGETVELGDRCVAYDGTNFIMDLLSTECPTDMNQESTCATSPGSYIISTFVPADASVSQTISVIVSDSEARESSDAAQTFWSLLAIVPFLIVLLL